MPFNWRAVIPAMCALIAALKMCYWQENVLLAAIQAFAVRSSAAHIYGSPRVTRELRDGGAAALSGGWTDGALSEDAAALNCGWSYFLRRNRSQWWMVVFFKTPPLSMVDGVISRTS
jgi:hypothetical protein